MNIQTDFNTNRKPIPPTDRLTHARVSRWFRENLPLHDWDSAETLAIEAAVHFDMLEWDVETSENSRVPEWICQLARLYFPGTH